MVEQLTLGMPLASAYRLSGFIPGKNQELLYLLKHLQEDIVDKGVYLWGDLGVGKTHLLQASCHDHITQGLTAIYVTPSAKPSCLEDVAHVALVAIDGVDGMLGDACWERALYHLYNQLTPRHSLIVSSRKPLSEHDFLLPDLRSRLASLGAYHVISLEDDAKRSALQAEALRRGLVLSDAVLDYLFSRYDRSLAFQMALLDQLDKASMVEQRRLTIPFVKTVID